MIPRPTPHGLRAIAAIGVLAVGGFALTACTSTPPDAPTSSPSASAVTTFDPDGTAADNQEFFDDVNLDVASAGEADGRSFIDALTDAGFDQSAMQLTPDTTSIGGDVEAVEFSVRLGDECLIGQVDSAGEYSSVVAPTVSNDACLVGSTRPIDWE